MLFCFICIRCVAVSVFQTRRKYKRSSKRILPRQSDWPINWLGSLHQFDIVWNDVGATLYTNRCYVTSFCILFTCIFCILDVFYTDGLTIYLLRFVHKCNRTDTAVVRVSCCCSMKRLFLKRSKVTRIFVTRNDDAHIYVCVNQHVWLRLEQKERSIVATLERATDSQSSNECEWKWKYTSFNPKQRTNANRKL